MWKLVSITAFLGVVTFVTSNSTEKKTDVIRSNAAPFYFSTPTETTPSFSCSDRSPGYYADPRFQCQVFHLCRSDGTFTTVRCQEQHQTGICLLKEITAKACQGSEIYLPEDIYFKDTTAPAATEYRLGGALPQPTVAPEGTTPLKGGVYEVFSKEPQGRPRDFSRGSKATDALIDIAPLDDRKAAFLVEVYNSDEDYSAYRRKAKKLFFGGKKSPGKHPRRKRSVESQQRGRPYAIVYAKVPDTTAASAGDPIPSERQEGMAFTYGQGMVQGGGPSHLVPLTIETRRRKNNRQRKKEPEQTSEQRNVYYYSPDSQQGPSAIQNQPPQQERPPLNLPNFPFQPQTFQSPPSRQYYYEPGYPPRYQQQQSPYQQQSPQQQPPRSAPPSERPRQQQQPPSQGYSGYPFFQNFPGFDEFTSSFSQRDPLSHYNLLQQQQPQQVVQGRPPVQERPQETPVGVQPGREPSPYMQSVPQQERPRQPPPEAPQRTTRPRGRPEEHVPVIVQEIPRPSRRPVPSELPQRPPQPQHSPYIHPSLLYPPQYPPEGAVMHHEAPQVERPESDPRPVVLVEDYRGEAPTRPHVVEEPQEVHDERQRTRVPSIPTRPHGVEEVMVREPVGRPRHRPEPVPTRPPQIVRQPTPDMIRDERQRVPPPTRHPQLVEEVVRQPERVRQRVPPPTRHPQLVEEVVRQPERVRQRIPPPTRHPQLVEEVVRQPERVRQRVPPPTRHPQAVEEVVRQPERVRQRGPPPTRHPQEEVVRQLERVRQRVRPEQDRPRGQSQYFSPTPPSPSRPSRTRKPEIEPQEEQPDFGVRRPEEERPRSRPVQESPVNHRFFEMPQQHHHQHEGHRGHATRPSRHHSSTPGASRHRTPQPQIERPPSEYVLAEHVPETHEGHRGHIIHQGNEVDRPRSAPGENRHQHHRTHLTGHHPEIETGFIPMTEATPGRESPAHRDRPSSHHEEHHRETDYRSRPGSQPYHEEHRHIEERPHHEIVEEERRPLVNNRYPEVDEVQTTRGPTSTRKPPPKPTFPTFPTFPPPPKRPVTSLPEHQETGVRTDTRPSTDLLLDGVVRETDYIEQPTSTTPAEVSTRKRTRKRKQRPRRPRPTAPSYLSEDDQTPGESVTQPTTVRDGVITPSSNPRSQSARWQKSTPNPRKSTTTTTTESTPDPQEFGSRINLFGRQRARRPTTRPAVTTTQPPATTVRTRKAFAKRARARPTTTEVPDTEAPIARSDENTELLIFEGYESTTLPEALLESTTDFIYPTTESYHEMVDTTTEVVPTTDETPQEDFESTRSIRKKSQNRPRVLKFGKPKLRTTLSPIDLNAAESRFG